MSERVARPKVEVEEVRDINSLLELDEETLDPEMHYRWVREAPRSMGNAKLKGYQIVNKEDGPKTRAGYLDDTGDGSMRIGDTILMACPRSMRRAREVKQRRFTESRLKAPRKQFSKSAKLRRARILKEEEGE